MVTQLAVVLLLLLSQGLAQTTSNNQPVNSDDPFAAKHRELLAKNPDGLSLTLQLKNKQNQFHPGEIIPLELRFTSSLPNTYVLDNAGCDRSGRLDIDTFVVDRTEDGIDPLHDYYAGGLFGFMGGGLRGIGALDNTPKLVNYDLNEWLRFDKPGKYRLYVVSGRITKGKPYHSDNTPVTPTSNLVEFEIVPRDPEWEKQTLASAAKLIDSSAKPRGYPNEAGHAGCRMLRFLGTEGAIKETIRRFRGEDQTCDFEYDFGLIGTPHREFARAEMEAALDNPDQPITGYFLNALTFLAFLRDHQTALPQFPFNDEAAKKAWQAESAERRHSFDAIKQKYLTHLARAVRLKQQSAGAISLETLLQTRTAGSQIDEATRNDFAVSMARVFFDLPVERQRALIEYQWNMISNPAMLPVLRQLYEHPPDMREFPAPFPGLAVLRIYQLAPDEGRQLILDEIKRPKLRVKIPILGLLPDKELPQLEDTIVERAISQDDETADALIARYVSAAALPRVRAGFENRIGELACANQASLISYFRRADQKFGLEMIRRALRSRKHTRCYPNVLTDAAGETITPEFEALAAEYLNDDDPEVVFSAVRVLCQHGSIANKPKIKAAIKQVIDQLRAAKVDPEASSSRGGPFPGYLVESLLRTYALAIPWFTTKDEFKELQELCLTRQCPQQLKPRDLTAETDIHFFHFEGVREERRFTVGSYESLSWHALKEKVIQFPKGTKFTWHADNNVTEIDRQLFDELKGYLNEHGFELARFVPKQNETQ
ncbi:MAG TPA: hypothetical protein VF397_05580 [Pyrinomonadaceae bacterium]